MSGQKEEIDRWAPTAAAFWNGFVKRWLTGKCGGRYIRHESLAVNPEHEVRRMLQIMGIEGVEPAVFPTKKTSQAIKHPCYCKETYDKITNACKEGLKITGYEPCTNTS